MSTIDWLVMGVTLLAIVSYGMWKSRGTKNIQGFLLADKKLPWYHVGLSVMATQASAITFLSAPGQAFSDGMRFLQFYFGLPLAMIVLCVTFIPIFQKLNVVKKDFIMTNLNNVEKIVYLIVCNKIKMNV